MSDSKAFAKKFEKGEAISREGFTSERQHTGRAYALRVKSRDGRKAEGFAWALFNGYRWTDDGQRESLTLIFASRAIHITGRHLGRVVDEIDEEQLKSLQEHDTREFTERDERKEARSSGSPSSRSSMSL